ncbi:sugar kinase [Insolitispirillum peregrinum]|uniref:2-dehydro-3-deoxygluconokinase n=1 Tax=Insolitispirillum peregrinum TaxID=80876 RepID=A0A1N7N0N8_9PROT|nr:sugar kinase [Insolitispirillum peregrinum]SIS91936.1 2-keto-3-deoxygluconate kinase [Insolitispirillum peregrinum]
MSTLPPLLTGRIAALGECMLELRQGPGGLVLGFGGDTLNTAVYMARLGAAVDYVTALGDDGHSAQMVAAWQAEGVGCQHVLRLPGRVPGLYMIETDPTGERRFLYWRDSAPARELFTLPQTPALQQALMSCPMLFLSGISLAIWGEQGRAQLFAFLDRYRQAGGRVAFDTNWRPRLWADRTQAQAAYQAMLQRTDLALPGEEDLSALYGDQGAEAVMARVAAFGISEIVLKLAQPGCLVRWGGQQVAVPAVSGVQVVDTTAAGDSFAAGYLAARRTVGPADAAAVGARLAAVVVAHPGAIIDRSVMPVGLLAQ